MGKHVAGGGRRVARAKAGAQSGLDADAQMLLDVQDGTDREPVTPLNPKIASRLFSEMQANANSVADARKVRPGFQGISRPFKASDLKEFALSEPKVAAVAKEYLGSGRRLSFTTRRGGGQFYQSEGDRITYFIPTGRTYRGKPVYQQSVANVPARNAPQTRSVNAIEGYSSPLPSGSYAVRQQTTQYAEMVDITYFR